MDIWKILGVSPTKDKKKIRRAYAAQSKMHHPEEDPKGFAQLKDAYQQALLWCEEPAPQGWQFRQQNRGQEFFEEDPEKSSTKIPEPPSIDLLSQVHMEEKRRIEESLRSGGLSHLREIFEDAKKCKKQGVWQQYFLSDEFLEEQYHDEFAKGLLSYLRDQRIVPFYNLPLNFVVELAIAYAMMPERIDILQEGMEIYQMQQEGGVYPKRMVAEIWNAQTEEITSGGNYRTDNCHAPFSAQAYTMLNRADHMARFRAFDIYHRLKAMNQQGYLTEREQGQWGDMLLGLNIENFYERNKNQLRKYDKSECIVRLLTFWIEHESVPKCILEHLYKGCALKHLEGSSKKTLFVPLREAVLEKYPDIAEFERLDEKISLWYQELTKIISEYHENYDSGIYTETDAIKERVEALFLRPEWKDIQYEQRLFKKIFLRLNGRRVVPKTLALRLLAFYSEEAPWEEPDKVAALKDGLQRSLRFMYRMREMDWRTEYVYEKTSINDISDDNMEFWLYFLMWGFGNRYIVIIGETDSYKRNLSYIINNYCYLTLYIKEQYYPYLSDQPLWNPTIEWQKRFTGFDEEEDRMKEPVSTEFTLPDGNMFRVEFHLHYCLYFLDGVQVIGTAFTFSEWKELAAKLTRTEQVFFLLAVTAIAKPEREEAKALIAGWLDRLPLYENTKPLIAEMLAAANAENKPEENEVKRVVAEIYGEQEKLCFKIAISKRSFKLYRQAQTGWTEMALLDGEGKYAKKLEIDEKMVFAKEKLEKLRQPKPYRIASYNVKDMDTMQKAQIIIKAMKEAEQYRTHREQPYAPGFPWNPEEITQSVKDFFAQDGGWMTQSYCILHYGTQKGKRFERLFYCVMNIFGFDLGFQSPQFVQSLNFNEKELKRKVKEHNLVAGHFGWGKQYSPKYCFEPQAFAIGSSGKFYLYTGLYLICADTFAELIAKAVDLSDVTEVTIYEGIMSVSRFNFDIEYCYTEQDYKNWMYEKTRLLPNEMTKFGI